MRVLKYFVISATAFVQKPLLFESYSRVHPKPDEIGVVEQLDKLRDTLRDILEKLGKKVAEPRQRTPALIPIPIPIPILTPEEEYIQREKKAKQYESESLF